MNRNQVEEIKKKKERQTTPSCGSTCRPKKTFDVNTGNLGLTLEQQIEEIEDRNESDGRQKQDRKVKERG